MNIYELRSGMLIYYVAADNEDDAREQGQDAQRFPDMHFLPFSVKRIEVEGAKITVKRVRKQEITQDEDTPQQTGDETTEYEVEVNETGEPIETENVENDGEVAE